MLGRVCRIQQGGLGSFSIFGRLFTTRASGYKTVKDFSPEDLKGKTVFLRADLNVPITKEADAAGNFSITDDTRIVSAVPTIKHLMDQGARVILSSHMGRPKGKRSERLSLKPVSHFQLQIKVVCYDSSSLLSELCFCYSFKLYVWKEERPWTSTFVEKNCVRNFQWYYHTRSPSVCKSCWGIKTLRERTMWLAHK